MLAVRNFTSNNLVFGQMLTTFGPIETHRSYSPAIVSFMSFGIENNLNLKKYPSCFVTYSKDTFLNQKH